MFCYRCLSSYERQPSNFVYSLRVTKYILGQKTKLLRLILPPFFHLLLQFIYSIFFLYNSKTLNFGHTFLWGWQIWVLVHTWAMGWSIVYTKIKQPVHTCTCSLFFFFFLPLQYENIKNLYLQNCFNIPLMAMAGGMWALLTICYIYYSPALNKQIYFNVNSARCTCNLHCICILL